MADFEKGQTFIDKQAVNLDQTKAKYFIGMCNAEYDDDLIVCFVMNTEKRMDQYHLNCNKEACRFIIEPSTFSFITKPTSIMLKREWIYKMSELYNSNIKLLDKADETLARQIKNCIDWNHIMLKSKKLIIVSFRK